MILNDEEKRMLDGKHGPGVQWSMNLLKRFGEAFDAEKMTRVNLVHMSTNLPMDLLLKMAEGVDKLRTTCSLHAVFDPTFWREEYGIAGKKGQTIAGVAETDEEEFRQRIGTLKKLGCYPSFTCVPYGVGFVLRQGDVFLATGSSGQVAANSLFAARAGRESSSTAFASAVTGVTPYMGLLVKENRYAEVLIKVEGLDLAKFGNADYGALGYYIGEVAGIRNVVIEGLPATISLEQCKYLTSPLPVSGACTMCHIVGVTPEAPTLEVALGGKKPREVVKVGKKEIAEAYGKLNTAKDRNVDQVALGCPHCFISEMKELASLLEGKKVKKGVRLLIATSNSTSTMAKDAGYIDIIKESGAIISNICASVVNPLIVLGGARVVATNSARGAHYIPRVTGGKTNVFYGDVKQCVKAAITGKWEG